MESMASPCHCKRISSWRRLWLLGVVMLSLALSNSVGEVDAAGSGNWRMITKNAGVSAMHAGVTHLGTVVLLEHTNMGPTNVTFEGRCRVTDYDEILKRDCFAHSVLLDPASGEVRPLMVMTDTFCSSGQFEADGTLRQTGGDKEGVRNIRTLSPSCYALNRTKGANQTHCDWVDTDAKLTQDRWYSTNQLLPDGRQIVVGGRNTPSVELVPPKNPGDVALFLPFLDQANPQLEYKSLYPFVHLLQKTGQLYIFEGRDSIIYNYLTNTVVKTFDKIPGNARTYPSAGSSVMLPLTFGTNYQKFEILVCGGASTGSVNINVEKICSITCGRMEVTKAKPTWVIEDMPIPRCMGDMVLLPDMNVLIINGAQRGFQSYQKASVPVLNPVLYQQKNKLGSRFVALSGTETPRVYHSTASLLPDASVMIAGSNTNPYYIFREPTNTRQFPTELSVESFTPPYAGDAAGGRPFIISCDANTVKYNAVISVQFWDFNRGKPASGQPPVVDTKDTFLYTLRSSPWSTHSFSQGQRLLSIQPLGFTNQFVRKEQGVWVNDRTVSLRIPKYSTVAPAAYYMLWVVKNGNPSQSCIWIRIRT